MRIRRRFLAIGTLLSTVAVVGAILPIVHSEAAAAAVVTYTYDADGRISTVTNASGTTATYHYDAVGNVVSITHSTAATRKRPSVAPPRVTGPSIDQVDPSVAASGSQVTIQGRGFDPQTANDVVRIGSLIAPVVSASPTRLVVTAPPGPGGAVNVTTSAGDVTKGAVRVTGTSDQSAVAAPVSAAALRGAPRAAAGITALSGLVERNDGRPLAGIRISISDGWDSSEASTLTNQSGWFLLPDLASGSHVLYIDGGASSFGLYSEPISVASGKTTVVPWITYLTPLDMSTSVKLAPTTTHTVTLESARLPGLEVVIPKGTSITDADGKPVDRVSLTALATGRTPFPWAPNMEPPYFTLQPEGSHVSGPGLQIIYPNQSNQPPGTKLSYLAFSPEWAGSGWYTYGSAHVSASGLQVLPNAGTVYHEITPGGYTTPPAPPGGPPPGGGPSGGEPVDLDTGLFTLNATDLSLSDALPVTLGRVFRPLDDEVRTFGIGTESTFDYIVQSSSNGDYDLYLPDGGKIPYAPSGTSGIYDATGTPTEFYGSTLTAQGDSDGPFLISLTDGTSLQFSNPAYLISISDRFGNKIDINRNDGEYPSQGGGQINSITTPGGQWLKFTYGVCVPGTSPSYCVTSVTDSAKRTVTYTYNSDGQLTAVVGPGDDTTYKWASCTSSITCTEIVNGSHGGVSFITNTYDPTTGRVTNQTVGDGGHWAFSYITNSSGQVTQTDVTDADGHVEDYAFNADGYESSGETGVGTALVNTVTPVYSPTTNLLTSYTDSLGRETTFTYDSLGNMLTETQNATSSTPSTTTYTYEPKYNRVATVTNPLGQTTTFTYNDSANTIKITDPLGANTVVALNDEGQPISVTDPSGGTSYYSYLHGALVAYADPLGNVTSFYNNSIGEPVKVTDPEGNTTKYTWNAADDLLSQTDPLGGKTSYTYNGAGEVLSITDPNGHKTTYTYDGMLRPLTETDALGHTESVTYDHMGRVLTSTDRNGNKSTFTYDSLGRLVTANSGVSGTTSYDTVKYTYDLDNRLTKVVDSLTGTYSYTYDTLNDLLTASGPAGKLTYTYNRAGQQTAATVGGQTIVKYVDNADGNPTSLTQGSSKVTIRYDSDQQPTSTVLTDGITESATYNADSQITELSYADGSTSLGTLGYGYDSDGQVTSLSGSLATTNLPAALSSATYNADNELTASGSTTMTYDAEGDLLSNGTDTYTWNPEDQLASVTGPSLSATYTYDPFGQRESATVGATATTYLYDGNNVAQTQSGGSPVANMLTNGLDQTYQVTNSSGTYSLLADRLGDTIGLGTTTGTVATKYAYAPFGATTSSGTANPNAIDYIGAENDTSTGLYYLNARYYDPAIERFISQDPAGISGGTSDLYEYGYDQPIDFVDPLGLAASGEVTDGSASIAPAGPGEGGGPNSGPQGDYHGTAGHHPTIQGNGIAGGGSANSGIGQTSAIDETGATGATALATYAEQSTLDGTGGASSNAGLSPLSALTGMSVADVATDDASLLFSPDALLLLGNAVLGSRPWSEAFWNGQAPW